MGLFQKRLGLPRLYYSFEKAGWRFIILDDVWPNPDGTYYAEYKTDQLDFVQSELKIQSDTRTGVPEGRGQIRVHPGRASGLRGVGGLSDLDNVTVRIADVAANLAVLLLRLGDELGSSTFP